MRWMADEEFGGHDQLTSLGSINYHRVRPFLNPPISAWDGQNSSLDKRSCQVQVQELGGSAGTQIDIVSKLSRGLEVSIKQ